MQKNKVPANLRKSAGNTPRTSEGAIISLFYRSKPTGYTYLNQPKRKLVTFYLATELMIVHRLRCSAGRCLKKILNTSNKKGEE
jgi:hypothetical protein